MSLNTPENTAKSAFTRYIVKNPNVKLFSNITGKLWAGQPVSVKDGEVRLRFAKRLNVGFGEGWPDKVGWRQITITPDMVGKTVAQFTAVELKRWDKPARTTVEQLEIIDFINKQGGYAVLINSEQSMMEAFPNVTAST